MSSSVFFVVFNRLLQSSPWATERLRPFAGKTAHFDIPPFAVSFLVDDEGTFSPLPSSTPVTPPDVRISLPANAVFLIFSGFERVMSEAVVSGNAEFATELSFVMRNLRWDAEEDFARVFGDIPAHRLFNAGKGLLVAQHQFVQRMADNLTEYLTIESRNFTRSEDLRAFAESIACLDADLQRLDRRVSALKP
jgi:ubiquinone biosynthesis protein UbiJ